LPPVCKNRAGKSRGAGFEIEFGNLDGREAAQVVADLYGGRAIENDPHAFTVKGTRLGEFSIKPIHGMRIRLSRPATC
jgi:hypothetical protein